MKSLKEKVLETLASIDFPDGSNAVSNDLIRALQIVDGAVSFVVEIGNSEVNLYRPIIEKMKIELEKIDGVSDSSIVLTAEKQPLKKTISNSPKNLKIGKHPDPHEGSLKPENIKHIIAIGSGKGGVGKSTLSANIAVSLAKKGLAVGLLDADIYGPSQPKMLGISGRPKSPDGKTIIPLKAYGIAVMSIGFMVDPSKAVVWRGPMLQGALQQMLTQVEWGDLDILLVDLPPGTGDVQLTLSQKASLSGALIVSTPQDVSLIDARKAIDMFQTLNTKVIGLIENMSTYICPKCGHKAEIFGHGGVMAEAKNLAIPFLGEIPLDLDVRLSGDSGCPVSVGNKSVSQAFNDLADVLVKKLP